MAVSRSSEQAALLSPNRGVSAGAAFPLFLLLSVVGAVLVVLTPNHAGWPVESKKAGRSRGENQWAAV
eukprot:SAG11_NODE_33209_length_278_cov_1.318436_1_plen_67_part_10